MYLETAATVRVRRAAPGTGAHALDTYVREGIWASGVEGKQGRVGEESGQGGMMPVDLVRARGQHLDHGTERQCN